MTVATKPIEETKRLSAARSTLKTIEDLVFDTTVFNNDTLLNKLDRPILILHFLQSPIMSVEQTDALYDRIKDTNKDCTYHKIDALSGDFQGERLQRLLSWMNKYD